ncbi:hypothetical protein GWI33_008029 [Rhynchophorus ferrugineus]|uniref:Transposase n=1 Tax=Rhynchophorus ferrugineus TaxID=354439 RepID=A0A834MML1_RHYFE|nr:hypothetical protein GWI33_008029 [Rhynchophorus ferrugineus]
MSTEDGERRGRPKEVVTDENSKKIHKMILNDRKLKLNEIADTLKISTERVHHIIHEYLGRTEKRPHLKKNKVLLHKDNAPCHKSVKTMAKIHELDFELLPHPPYSPGLPPATIFCSQISKESSLGRSCRRMKR